MPVTVLDRDRIELATLENAHEISYTNRINEAPTASFALPVDDDKNDHCEIGRYVVLSDNNGKIGLYRINSPRLNTEQPQKYYDLFHVIDTLNDQMFPGKSSINDGLTQLTKSVEEEDTTLPIKDPSQFSAGDTVIIVGRSQSEKVTVDSIFGGGNNAKVKMEVRGSIGLISKSYKDEDVLKDQTLQLKSGVKNDYSAGTTVAIPISIKNAINKVLDEQETKNWQLGACDFLIDDLVFQFHDSTLLDALFKIGKKIGEKYVWTWNTDSYPWTLNLKDPVETKPVGYIDRGVNLRAINLKRDPSKIATRLYPYGTDGISIKPVKGREYIQDDIAIEKWGIREKVVRTNHNTSSALLTAAENILDQRKEPQSTFQISAADLADVTGEDTHKFEIGDWVQITDPENDIKVKEILVSKSKNALQEDPAQINLEFANKTQFFETPDERLSGFRHDLENEVTETTNNFDQIRANLLGDIEDIREFRDETETLISDIQGKMGEQNVYINQTKDSLTQAIQNNEGDISVLQQTAEDIQLVVEDNEGNIGTLQTRATSIEANVSDLEGNFSDLQLEVDNIFATVSDHENRVSQLEINVGSIQTTVDSQGNTISQMTQTADAFDFTIYGSGSGTATMSGDDIVSQINLSSSGVVIKGDNIDISGKDINVSGDEITLNGSTNIEGGYNAFNVDSVVWLKGGYSTWPLTIPDQDIDDANFGVKQDGTVIAKEFKTTQNDPIIRNGVFEGAKVIRSGFVGGIDQDIGQYRPSGFGETDITVDLSIPDGRYWQVLVFPIHHLDVYDYDNEQYSTVGWDYNFYGSFNRSGSPTGLHGPESGSETVTLEYWAASYAPNADKNIRSTTWAFYMIISIPSKNVYNA